MLGVSQRLDAVQSPIIPVIGALVRAHPGTISLGQGVVYYEPPEEARLCVEEFFKRAENHKYQPVQGIPELLEALEAKLKSENGCAIGPENALMVTAGGNMAFMNAVLAIADPGDEIILQTPYYFNHEMAVAMANCRAVQVPTDAHYQLQPDAIRCAISSRTRAVVTVSPNNPTGAVYPEPAIREVNAICAEAGIYHIHDEAYEYFVHEGPPPFSPGSISGAERHTICLYSLSKAYGFASWRIGCMVFPAELLAAIKKVQDTILICPPVVSQYAALGALRAGRAWCAERIAEIREVRDLAVTQLRGIADRCEVPSAAGAFYLLLRVRSSLASMELAELLIREFKVAVLPGSTFGETESCLLRVAYGALRKKTAAEGIGRLVEGLKRFAWAE